MAKNAKQLTQADIDNFIMSQLSGSGRAPTTVAMHPRQYNALNKLSPMKDIGDLPTIENFKSL